MIRKALALGVLVVTFVAAPLACSGTTASSAGGSDSGGGDSGGLVSGCPATAPSMGGACGSVGLECEYGSDVNIDCDTIARCDASGWTVTPPRTQGCPTPPPGASCPATYAAVSVGSTCGTAASCAYPEGTCACEVYCGSQYPVGRMCEAGTPMTWQCTGAVQGCPAARPRIGYSCSMEAQTCNYGDCNSIGVICQNGTWHSHPNSCPVSTRRDKEGIHYLNDDELRAIADETLDTRLATYGYTIGDPSRRLGFVIEDQPGSPAVVPGQERVDLYGYTSMTVAALKVQRREIDELRRQVEELRRECRKTK